MNDRGNLEEGDDYKDAMTNKEGEGARIDSNRDQQDMQMVESIEAAPWTIEDAEPLNFKTSIWRDRWVDRRITVGSSNCNKTEKKVWDWIPGMWKGGFGTFHEVC